MLSASASFWPYMNSAPTRHLDEDGHDDLRRRVGQRVATGLHVHRHGIAARQLAERGVTDTPITDAR
jgi:hypothetical protein